MGFMREKRSPTSTSPCAHLKTAYHHCFNRWYSEKYLKGQWEKDECVTEWQKYRDCLSEHLNDKLLSRFLEAGGGTGNSPSTSEASFNSSVDGNSKTEAG